MAAAEQVFAVLEAPRAPAGKRTDVPDPACADLSIEGLKVTYPGRSEPALADRLADGRARARRWRSSAPAAAASPRCWLCCSGFSAPMRARSGSARSSSPSSTPRPGGHAWRGCRSDRTCSAPRSPRTCASAAATPRARRSWPRSPPPASPTSWPTCRRAWTRCSATAAPGSPRGAPARRAGARVPARRAAAAARRADRQPRRAHRAGVVRGDRPPRPRAHGRARRASPGAGGDGRPRGLARARRGRRMTPSPSAPLATTTISASRRRRCAHARARPPRRRAPGARDAARRRRGRRGDRPDRDLGLADLALGAAPAGVGPRGRDRRRAVLRPRARPVPLRRTAGRPRRGLPRAVADQGQRLHAPGAARPARPAGVPRAAICSRGSSTTSTRCRTCCCGWCRRSRSPSAWARRRSCWCARCSRRPA